MADETIQWDSDFPLAQPNYDDVIMGKSVSTGNPVKFRIEDIQAAAGNNVIGAASPGDSPSGTETNGQSYRVSNDTGADQTFTNFLTNVPDGSGGFLPVVVPTKTSGLLTKSGGSWVFVKDELNTAGLVPKTDIVDNLTTPDATKPLSAKQAQELTPNGGYTDTTQDLADATAYASDNFVWQNLIDIDKVLVGLVLKTTDGTTSVSGTNDTTPFLKALPNTSYSVSVLSTWVICEYDSAKNFIKSTVVSGSGTFTTGSTTAFVRMSFGHIYLGIVQLMKGTVKPYQNYLFGINKLAIAADKILGVLPLSKLPVMPAKNIEGYMPGKNLIDISTAVPNTTLDASGAQNASATYSLIPFFKVLPNTVYTLTTTRFHWTAYYDINLNPISSTPHSPTDVNTEATPANAIYVQFAFDAIGSDPALQYELGPAKTEYQAFGYSLDKLLLPKIPDTPNIHTVTNRVSKSLRDLFPVLYLHLNKRDKDICIVWLGDSLSTMNGYATPRLDASTRPPLMIEFAHPTFVEELLRWPGQEYKRFDVAGIFTETFSTASTVTTDPAWDWENPAIINRPSITRILDGTNCSTSYLIPISANRCDFIIRTDYLNAVNATITISKGNNSVKVFDETTGTYIEANGYSYTAKELDQILVGPSGNYRESVYQKRIKMLTTRTKNDGAITVTITNNGAGRLTYWGIQHSPLNFMLDFLCNARGGHNIAKLRCFERVDVDAFKPDLILKQSCTNNENIVMAADDGTPADRSTNTPDAMANRFLTYINSLETKSYAPAVVNWTLGPSYTTNWTKKTSNDVLYGYSGDVKYTGYDYHDYLDAFLRANSKTQLDVWNCLNAEMNARSAELGVSIMQGILLASGQAGDSWVIDGTHPNNNGAKVIFEILRPFFI